MIYAAGTALGWVSVLGYGADPAGVADSTAAIDAATAPGAGTSNVSVNWQGAV